MEPLKSFVKRFDVFANNFKTKICVDDIKLSVKTAQSLFGTYVAKYNILKFSTNLLLAYVYGIWISVSFEGLNNVLDIRSPVVTCIQRSREYLVLSW